MIESIIRDPSLAESGVMKIEWVKRRMPVLAAVGKELASSGSLRGRRIGLALHVEAKTALLALTLHEAGADVAICGCNPLSTQDDVAAGLAASGVKVFGWRGCTTDEYDGFLARVLDTRPDLVIDDGADLITMMHTTRTEVLPGIIGATEETTTGIQRLRAMEREGVLRFPVMAVNNAMCKYLFDNRYGTGQSTWDGIMRATNLLIAGKRVAVMGYGWCGKGVAMRARGLGARVIVCEVDPIAANEAICDGYDVMHSLEAARQADIFVTVTGCASILRREHFEVMKDGAILANAGHFDVEISKDDLASLAVERKQVRANVEQFTMADGRRLYLLAEGRLVNLAAGDGHPAEIMDLSFALQALALQYVAQNAGNLGSRVVPLPREVDEHVARLKLAADGVSIDTLSDKQLRYINSWRV